MDHIEIDGYLAAREVTYREGEEAGPLCATLHFRANGRTCSGMVARLGQGWVSALYDDAGNVVRKGSEGDELLHAGDALADVLYNALVWAQESTPAPKNTAVGGSRAR